MKTIIKILVLSVLGGAFVSVASAKTVSKAKKTNAQLAQNKKKTNDTMSADSVSSLKEEEVEQPKYDDQKIRIAVDGAGLVNKGIGAFAEYTVHPRITVGPNFEYFHLDYSGAKDSLNMGHDVYLYGLRGRYFFTNDANKTGFYVMGGGAFVQVNTRAAFAGTKAGTSQDYTFGPQLGTGFQAAGLQIYRVKFLLNIGVTYASGYQVAATASTLNNSPTEVSKPSIDSNVFFESAIGIMF